MCELFALSASAPVDIKLSLAEIARHGGETGIHTDGWGVAFLEGRDARLFREPIAAATSPWVQCLQAHPIKSDTVVAHIRHATQGAISLANTQPFQRELDGRIHVFAHNGNLNARSPAFSEPRRFQPIGETDSELAFCLLLERLARARKDQQSPEQGIDLEIFAEFAREMRERGPANLILASGGELLIHADRRIQDTGKIEAPGLWLLQRACSLAPPSHFAGGGVSVTGEAPSVLLVASVPLSAEAWQPLPRGTVLVAKAGRIVRSMRP